MDCVHLVCAKLQAAVALSFHQAEIVSSVSSYFYVPLHRQVDPNMK